MKDKLNNWWHSTKYWQWQEYDGGKEVIGMILIVAYVLWIIYDFFFGTGGGSSSPYYDPS